MSQNQMEVTGEVKSVTTLAVPAAVASMAAQAKAEIEAAYVMARQNRRNIDNVLISIKESCKRPRFAKVAKYAKPVGGNQLVVGPSIRFAEEAIRAMGNIRVQTMVLVDDDNTRTVRVSVVDLESLAGYSKDIVIAKTVERNFLKPGMIVVSERENCQGRKTYLVRATESDLSNKVAAEESKVIRNCGLRLIPRDIIDEAMEQVDKTNGDECAQAPDEVRKKVMDAFASIGVIPSEIEAYLGYPLKQLTAPAIQHLRAIFQTISDGEARWADYMAVKQPEKAVVPTDILDGIKAGDVSTHKPPSAAPQEAAKPEPVQEKPATEAQQPVETPAAAPAPEPAPATEEAEPEVPAESTQEAAASDDEVTVKLEKVIGVKSANGIRYKAISVDGDAFYTTDKNVATGLNGLCKAGQAVRLAFKVDGMDAMITKVVA